MEKVAAVRSESRRDAKSIVISVYVDARVKATSNRRDVHAGQRVRARARVPAKLGRWANWPLSLSLSGSLSYSRLRRASRLNFAGDGSGKVREVLSPPRRASRLNFADFADVHGSPKRHVQHRGAHIALGPRGEEPRDERRPQRSVVPIGQVPARSERSERSEKCARRHQLTSPRSSADFADFADFADVRPAVAPPAAPERALAFGLGQLERRARPRAPLRLGVCVRRPDSEPGGLLWHL